MTKVKMTWPKEKQECKDGKCNHIHEIIQETTKKDSTTPDGVPKTEVIDDSKESEPKIKEVEKIVEKVKAPKDQPFFKCKDCGDKHPNPNYSEKPNKQCPSCGTLNGQKNCKNCNKETDSDDWNELDDDELADMGVPLPEEKDKHDGHDHKLE